ncbi:hypothetical protein [Sporofaciens sp. JLR.KK001]|uniref:hypothetical protein n=1 Tax=Sporofaciens sp. JLR.KK001 TaxID=3112621 RepID=UPI0003366787|nr:hypothetical protein C809_02693 [Lachnospiraceae bacterium MD335]
MRKYSKEQKAYIEAKKALDILESQEKKMEADFVKSLGIVNEDGSVPVATWAIDDDEAADKAIEDFGKLVEESGLWAKLVEAKETFRQAEENLVQYALSLIPFKKEREALARVSNVLKYRQTILDTVLRLDASTVSMITK